MKRNRANIKIKKSRGYKFFISFIVGLVWGVLVGALGISTLVSKRLDAFYEQISYLEHTIEDKDEKLNKLEESINNANIILKDIYLILEFPKLSEEKLEQIDSIEIEKAIKEKYASLLGKEVKNMDVDILVEVIDRRILKFNNGEYQLTVKKLVLSDILKLWVDVSLLEIAS